MAERRDSPYVWVTWITRLLAGEHHCEWAAWFRAHHKNYAKQPTDFDLAQWAADHADLVKTRAAQLQADGFTTTLEDQNKFTLKGASGAALGGKPDIVAKKGDRVTVVDCKTGKQRDSDYFQVLTYMTALPSARYEFRGMEIAGEVAYKDRPIPVAAADLTAEVKGGIFKLLERVCGAVELQRVPSYSECSFCDISAVDCPERIEVAPSGDHEYLAPF